MIEIVGGQRYQKDRVHSMVVFCIHSLMPRMIGRLYIRIELKRNMCRNTGNLGMCYWTDTNNRPRDFTIEADASMPLRTLLITIAHELVHVKQMARNEQKQLLVANKVKWMGKTINMDQTDYWDLPWEIEAHGREIGLFIKWCKLHNVENKPWTFDKNEP